MIVNSHPNARDKGKRSRCTERTRTQRKKSQHENSMRMTSKTLYSLSFGHWRLARWLEEVFGQH